MSLSRLGDRIRLDEMTHDPDPIPPGTTGTVREVFPVFQGRTQLWVDWGTPGR